MKALAHALALLPLLALTGLPAVSGCQRDQPQVGEAGAERVSWKLASTFPATLPILGTGAVAMTEKLRTVTRGRIDIKFFDPGKLVPPLEVFDATSQGAVDAGWAASGYWVGKIPAAAFFTSVPFGPEATEYVAWLYNGGGWQLWKELYGPSNIYPIPCGLSPPDTSGWFRTEIDSLEQLRGMKIRYFGLGGQVLQKLGASVQLLAGGDIYPALERGVLDGLEFATPAVDRDLGFFRIAKHYYFPGWHQQHSVQELLINMDRWIALHPADQLLIEMACRDSMLSMVAEGESAQGPVLEYFRDNGVSLHYWPDEILQGFKAAYAEVIAENVAADEGFRRVWESYDAFRQSFAEWGRLSRLPQDL